MQLTRTRSISSIESSIDASRDGVSAKLAQFSSGLRLEQVPAEVVAHVRYLTLDAIGCCLQGSTLPWTGLVRDMVLAEAGPPQSNLIGTSNRVSVSQAVLVNATAGHAFEMDDIHRDSIIHAGSIVVPIALAFGEARGSMTGKHFLEAVIAGYETGTRVGSAASQSLLLKGFHPQGTTGTFAAGAAAARALNLDADKTLHTMGSAASQAAGLMASQEGAMVKRFHSGRAAQSGVYAALLSERGFTGIENVIEAEYGGYLHAFSDDPQPQRVLADLGERWETAAVGYKPFAAVTSIHTALEALASIMSTHDLKADDIEHVDAFVSEPTYQHCAWPYRSQSVTAAQMNLFFGLAVMALEGAVSAAQFQPNRISDRRILDFIERISATSDDEINAGGPAARHTARIVVTARDGRVLELTVDTRRGSPENPITEAEVEGKFRANAGTVLGDARVSEVFDLVMGLEGIDDVSRLGDLLSVE